VVNFLTCLFDVSQINTIGDLSDAYVHPTWPGFIAALILDNVVMETNIKKFFHKTQMAGNPAIV